MQELPSVVFLHPVRANLLLRRHVKVSLQSFGPVRIPSKKGASRAASAPCKKCMVVGWHRRRYRPAKTRSVGRSGGDYGGLFSTFSELGIHLLGGLGQAARRVL